MLCMHGFCTTGYSFLIQLDSRIRDLISLYIEKTSSLVGVNHNECHCLFVVLCSITVFLSLTTLYHTQSFCCLCTDHETNYGMHRGDDATVHRTST